MPNGEESGVNIWGGLVIIGAVAASVGLTLFGMGTSTLQTDGQLFNIGLILMIGGVVALAVGWLAWKATTNSSR